MGRSSPAGSCMQRSGDHPRIGATGGTDSGGEVGSPWLVGSGGESLLGLRACSDPLRDACCKAHYHKAVRGQRREERKQSAGWRTQFLVSPFHLKNTQEVKITTPLLVLSLFTAEVFVVCCGNRVLPYFLLFLTLNGYMRLFCKAQFMNI